MGAFLFQLLVAVVSVVVALAFRLHLLIKGRLQISTGLIGEAEQYKEYIA
jgi:hypothetical protein